MTHNGNTGQRADGAGRCRRPLLETSLREKRGQNRSLLVPFVTAGVRADWVDLVRGFAEAGADAIEIGLPFSDPMLEGPTIQQASQQALRNGMSTARALDQVRGLDLGIPLVVMTYSNLIRRPGPEAFCAALAEAGVSGLIPVDTPLDEAPPLVAAANAAGVQTVLIVAPSTPPDRIGQVAELGSGFIYASTVMGTTGERATLGEQAGALADRVRARTDRPVLLGFGISGPETAVEAARRADGVIMGAALMQRVLNGESTDDVVAAFAGVRSALDARPPKAARARADQPVV